MTKEYVTLLTEKFESSLKECRKMKVGPMKFSIVAMDIEGVGRLSVMEGTAMFGLMKMDTIMLTPAKKDAPLISYDRIFAMGNDTLIIEMYDTCVNSKSYPTLAKIKEKYAGLPERDPGKHWYDDIKCPESLSKAGKKITPEMTAFAKEYLAEYASILAASPEVDEVEKQKKNSEYVEGLLNNGGPSTDQFIKAIGKEKTAELFRTVLFGTK